MPVIKINKITVNPLRNYFWTVGSFDGGGAAFDIELDPSLFTLSGEYVLVASSAPLTNYAGANVSFSGSGPAVLYTTPSGSIGETRTISGSSYYCITTII